MPYTKAGRRALPYPQKRASVDEGVSNSRGGKREGAGRKPTGVVTASFSLRPDQIEWLEAQEINTGESKSAIVRAALDVYIKRKR